MSRTAKLIMITEDNHNKYYNMSDNGSVISVEYGRVGATCQTASYPSSKWSSLYASKTKKGYKDVTELFTVGPSASKVQFSDISDRFIAELINKLEAYTKKQVSTNYNVTADTVTQKQIDEAQSIINYLTSVNKADNFNKYLLELFSVIPRKMKKVADHLADPKSDLDSSWVNKVIGDEQELLDTMAQQVKQIILTNENTNDKLTLLDALGLEIFNVLPDQEKMIKNKLGMISDKYVKAFKVVNRKTADKFNKYVEKKDNKKVELFWHGSRNENWMPILQTGLLIRPSNAVYTGSMFGDGIYGADKAIKSFGYTSGRGSYWARGSANEAFMALFKFHVGKQLELQKWESWMSHINKQTLKDKGNYDSVFAKGGADLKNNEYIVYDSDATTVYYIIQLKG